MKKPVDVLTYIFIAPIITWPTCEGFVTKEMAARAKMERLAAASTLKEEATEYEALLYVGSVSLAFPPNQLLCKLYGYLFRRFYPENKEIAEGFGEPNEYELRELIRLRRWIYKKQIEEVKQRLKATAKFSKFSFWVIKN